jgi:hypothetical protein
VRTVEHPRPIAQRGGVGEFVLGRLFS